METITSESAERNRLMNTYRREAIEMWQQRSPTRQQWYILARLKGFTPEQANDRSRGDVRKKGYAK